MKKTKSSNKKNIKQPTKVYHKYNIFMEVSVGLALPIIASLWLGNYYSDKADTNLMLESLFIGIAIGFLNILILLHKEISIFYHKHHHPKKKKK